MGVCFARADGSHRARYVRTPPSWRNGFFSRVSWSPKGRYAALVRAVERKSGRVSTDLVVADAGGRTLRHLYRDIEYPGELEPAWSPDGRWIAIGGGGHGGSVGVIPAGGGGWREIIGDLYISLQSPTWTPDSRRLAFSILYTRGLLPGEASGTPKDGRLRTE